ncbi:FliI/YscN family ATPase [Roseovarius sp. A21]|uniref:FliI/YscN family ATPase n=1 Tax=Roseovarius bejariae TaxID=2576383 RepID=A0A844D2J8_9RHOB|nr:FliI/YscN family ATPase [Roseovarius bejariae]MRU15448.1 FliI/YscN family ATPase [Roseovarius bejariae]
MIQDTLTPPTPQIARLKADRPLGRVSAVQGHSLCLSGLSGEARLGDRVRIDRVAGPLFGEVVQLEEGRTVVLPDEVPVGVALGDSALLLDAATISPAPGWIGRVVDPLGNPLDGMPLASGQVPYALRAHPPAPAERRALGARLETGMAAFNTVLPIVRGQRLGLFAGSGVGKSSLLGHLGKNMQADVVVFALIGERGRELREFVEKVLGPEGMRRAIIVAATSDMSPLIRRRCAWAAMAVAEYFRDLGHQVLFLADSITRFAEAHREVATVSGELPALRGYPASTSHMIMSLCERAGPGAGSAGDITALFSVLVAGSDMDEPVADILRGVLDGHVVLDRAIAERGRYPAVDLLRSVSRSLPDAASDAENDLISQARARLGAYAASETMIRAGLYTEGNDPDLDTAVRTWPELDAFLAETEPHTTADSFARLGLILRRGVGGRGHARNEQTGPGQMTKANRVNQRGR